ncbi:MAG: MFS transporter [Rhizomicrobium sp.]|jgi:Na+/melibiose symporter-like transporter
MVDSILDPADLGVIAPNIGTAQRDAKAPPVDPAVTRDLHSTKTKLYYGFGSIAFGIKDNGFQTILLLFYNQVIGLPGPLVGGAIFIALVFDAFLDPIVGQFSDNLRTRWGRRHPLMYLSALPVAVSYLLLWNPPHWSHNALFLYLIVVAIVVRIFITLYEIPSSALAPELSADYDQRTVFLAYRNFFGWLGGMSMYMLAFAVFLTPDATHRNGQLNAAGYHSYGITAAVLMFAAIMISALGTHRYIKHFRVMPQRRIGAFALIREMTSTLSNRSFLVLFVAGIFFNAATGLVFALGVYFNTFFWGLTSFQIFILAIGILLAAALAFAVALPLSRRFGKKHAAMVLFAFSLVVGAIPLSLRLLGAFPANGSHWLVPALAFFNIMTATTGIASSILLGSMLADIVEDSERVTGRRSEGLFFAANSFMAKAASGLGLLLSGLVLAVVHFPSNAAPGGIDPHIVRNLALVYVPSIMVLYGAAIAIVGFYRITRESHEENLRRLAEEAALASSTIGTEAALIGASIPRADPGHS